MKIITGTKKEIALAEWTETIKEHQKRLDASIKCFELFKGIDDLDRIIEDCEKIIENAKHTQQVINYIKQNNIR